MVCGVCGVCMCGVWGVWDVYVWDVCVDMNAEVFRVQRSLDSSELGIQLVMHSLMWGARNQPLVLCRGTVHS